MRHYPELNDEYDRKLMKKLNPKKWQLELLKANPDYCAWGNEEDLMMIDGESWRSRVFYESWKTFDWQLNNLNELINFYFEVYRDEERCERCNGVGYNDETMKLYNTFYSHSSKWKGWSKELTDDDIQALADSRNLTFKEAKDVVEGNIGLGMGVLDRHALVKYRAKKRGVYGRCEECDGNGFIYRDDKTKVGLQLWIIHPRKGCGRGVYIKEIERDDISKVFDYLDKARKRNDERFAGIDILEDV